MLLQNRLLSTIVDMSSVEECICIKDFEILAEKMAPPNVITYVNSGSMDEQTLAENCTAFKKWRFQPRCLIDVPKVSLNCTVLDENFNFPIGISPTGQMTLLSEGGEADMAKAAESLGTVFTEGTHASVSLEDVATATPNCYKWFQSYVQNDRDETVSLIKRAEKSGYKGIVVTVDFPVPGKRYRLLKAEPFTFLTANLKRDSADWSSLDSDLCEFRTTWRDIEWLKSVTKLPIIVKGIMTPQSAALAAEHGAAAVWVSNHGGRQFDGVLPTIYALPAIAKAIKGRCPIFFDGGVRNGADVAKAIALGADCVFVGRPVVWGIACGGVSGAKKVLEILRDELELTMKLLGVASIDELQSDPNLVIHESKIIADL